MADSAEDSEADAALDRVPPGSTAANRVGTLGKRIAALGPWFHNMDLDGVPTAPDHFLGDYPTVKWRGFAHALPADLAGRSVLDIGCNAGFYSFEMKRRGAGRVLGIDEDPRYLAQACLAAEILGHDVEFRQLSVYDVGVLGTRFDIVLFMGVLYHLRHPLLALDLIHAHVAGDLLVFQSMQRGSPDILEPEPDYPFAETAVFEAAGWPRLHFVERAYAGDWTNWWVPNRACAAAMLRSAGFTVLENPEPEVFLCRRDAAPSVGAVYPQRPDDLRRPERQANPTGKGGACSKP